MAIQITFGQSLGWVSMFSLFWLKSFSPFVTLKTASMSHSRASCYFPLYVCYRPFNPACWWTISALKWNNFNVFFFVIKRLFELINMIDTFVQFLMHSHLGPSMWSMSGFQVCMTPYPNTSRIQNLDHGVTTQLVQWMGHISIAVHQQKNGMQQEIEKELYHKTAWPVFHLQWSSSTLSVDGKGQLLMPLCMPTPVSVISQFLQASSILPMLDLEFVTPYWFHFVVFITTLLSGAVLMQGIYLLHHI